MTSTPDHIAYQIQSTLRTRGCPTALVKALPASQHLPKTDGYYLGISTNDPLESDQAQVEMANYPMTINFVGWSKDNEGNLLMVYFAPFMPWSNTGK